MEFEGALQYLVLITTGTRNYLAKLPIGITPSNVEGLSVANANYSPYSHVMKICMKLIEIVAQV